MERTAHRLRGVAGAAVVIGLAVALLTVGAVPIGAAADGGDAPPTLMEQFIDQAEKIGKGRVTLAVVRSADRGYDLGQILQGVFAGSMEADGTVTEDGAPVEPALPPAGVIADNAPSTAGPGKARGAATRTAEDVTLGELERGVKESQRQLKRSLGRIAGSYETTSDVAAMLVILALAKEGYSIEQIIVDGIMGQGIDAPLFEPAVIRDRPGGEGDVVTPEFAQPPAGGSSNDDDAISGFLDGVLDAVSGEDPLAVGDNSFARQYTVTIEVEVADDGATLRIDGKANAGAAKGFEDSGIVAGRGAGTLVGEAACRTPTDPNPYPYTLRAPVRLGVLGRPADTDDDTVRLGIKAAPTGAVRVQAEGDTLCLDIVRESADAVPTLIDIPIVTVRWKNGASATEEGTTSSGLPVTVQVSIRKI